MKEEKIVKVLSLAVLFVFGLSMVAPANGETLLFAAEGAFPEIEDSIFFAWPGGARQCAQIVLRGKAAPGAELRWSFRRV